MGNLYNNVGATGPILIALLLWGTILFVGDWMVINRVCVECTLVEQTTVIGPSVIGPPLLGRALFDHPLLDRATRPVAPTFVW